MDGVGGVGLGTPSGASDAPECGAESPPGSGVGPGCGLAGIESGAVLARGGGVSVSTCGGVMSRGADSGCARDLVCGACGSVWTPGATLGAGGGDPEPPSSRKRETIWKPPTTITTTAAATIKVRRRSVIFFGCAEPPEAALDLSCGVAKAAARAARRAAAMKSDLPPPGSGITGGLEFDHGFGRGNPDSGRRLAARAAGGREARLERMIRRQTRVDRRPRNREPPRCNFRLDGLCCLIGRFGGKVIGSVRNL